MATSFNFWDLTEKERSLLTEQDIEKFVDYELMSKGVLKIVVPEIEEETPITLDTQQYYIVEDKMGHEYNCLFETVEQADAFIALNPKRSDYEYSIGYDYKFARSSQTLSIKTMTLYKEHEVMQHKSVLDKNKEIKANNEQARKEYSEAVKAMKEATQGLWEDYYECKAKARKLERVLETYQQYLEMCKGDVQIALGFLGKAFTSQDIDEAGDWFDVPALRSAKAA